MKPTRCARPGCGVALTAIQLLKQGRYCSLRCSSRMSRRKRADSQTAIAARLGIKRHVLRDAIKTGRYVDGVYTPRRKGKPTQ